MRDLLKVLSQILRIEFPGLSGPVDLFMSKFCENSSV